MPTFPVFIVPYIPDVNVFSVPAENFRLAEEYSLITGTSPGRVATNAIGPTLSSVFSPGFTTYTNESGYGPIDSAIFSQIELSPECTESSPGTEVLNGTVTIPGSDEWPLLGEVKVLCFPRAPDNPGVHYRCGVFEILGPRFEIVASRVGRVFTFSGGAIGVHRNGIGDATSGIYTQVAALEIRIGGAVYNASLHAESNRFTIFNLPHNTYFNTSFELAHEFDGPAGTPVAVRLTDTEGYNTGWVEIVMPPVADFAYRADEDYGTEHYSQFTGDITPPVTGDRPYVTGTQVTADPASSFSPTGTLSDYYWGFSPPDPGPYLAPPRDQPHNTAPDPVTFSIEDLDSAFPGGTYPAKIELFVYDENWPVPAGADEDWQKHFTPLTPVPVVGYYDENYAVESFVIHPGGQISATHDSNNIMHTAARVDGGVQVSRYIGGTATKEPPAALSGARNPSLFRHGSTLHLVVQEGAAWNLHQSDDFGETFSLRASAIMNSNDFTGVQACALGDGGALLAGLKADTREVWTAYSLDGTHFEAPAPARDGSGAACAIPEGQRKTIAVFQETAAGAARIRITNGDAFTIVNDDYADAGGSWTAI